ncbi:hypothetical protein BDK51DRAFT_40999 [Blyttiomyces helicus]|uniref:Uncharacterized protein n=1 Tax=Blyttiomyces helicus TaxID=388810 RepID=A0A4P9WAL2_9FUNG|nr:hypothetical protein BDK51DRAFT_40999 [Blyttiomyces helicus]|eukprot:RKO88553.1 hypothetical protein BDK51DRAFT_40999 [Blyttiomyces helicus]
MVRSHTSPNPFSSFLSSPPDRVWTQTHPEPTRTRVPLTAPPRRESMASQRTLDVGQSAVRAVENTLGPTDGVRQSESRSPPERPVSADVTASPRSHRRLAALRPASADSATLTGGVSDPAPRMRPSLADDTSLIAGPPPLMGSMSRVLADLALRGPSPTPAVSKPELGNVFTPIVPLSPPRIIPPRGLRISGDATPPSSASVDVPPPMEPPSARTSLDIANRGSSPLPLDASQPAPNPARLPFEAAWTKPVSALGPASWVSPNLGRVERPSMWESPLRVSAELGLFPSARPPLSTEPAGPIIDTPPPLPSGTVTIMSRVRADLALRGHTPFPAPSVPEAPAALRRVVLEVVAETPIGVLAETASLAGHSSRGLGEVKPADTLDEIVSRQSADEPTPVGSDHSVLAISPLPAKAATSSSPPPSAPVLPQPLPQPRPLPLPAANFSTPAPSPITSPPNSPPLLASIYALTPCSTLDGTPVLPPAPRLPFAGDSIHCESYDAEITGDRRMSFSSLALGIKNIMSPVEDPSLMHQNSPRLSSFFSDSGPSTFGSSFLLSGQRPSSQDTAKSGSGATQASSSGSMGRTPDEYKPPWSAEDEVPPIRRKTTRWLQKKKRRARFIASVPATGKISVRRAEDGSLTVWLIDNEVQETVSGGAGGGGDVGVVDLGEWSGPFAAAVAHEISRCRTRRAGVGGRRRGSRTSSASTGTSYRPWSPLRGLRSPTGGGRRGTSSTSGSSNGILGPVDLGSSLLLSGIAPPRPPSSVTSSSMTSSRTPTSSMSTVSASSSRAPSASSSYAASGPALDFTTSLLLSGPGRLTTTSSGSRSLSSGGNSITAQLLSTLPGPADPLSPLHRGFSSMSPTEDLSHSLFLPHALPYPTPLPSSSPTSPLASSSSRSPPLDPTRRGRIPVPRNRTRTRTYLLRQTAPLAPESPPAPPPKSFAALYPRFDSLVDPGSTPPAPPADVDDDEDGWYDEEGDVSPTIEAASNSAVHPLAVAPAPAARVPTVHLRRVTVRGAGAPVVRRSGRFFARLERWLRARGALG